MPFLEYQISGYPKKWHVSESSESCTSSKNSYKASSLHALEEEIHFLRLQLEQLVLEGKEMTSEPVVQMSMLLDFKINKYMQLVKEND